MEDLKLFITSEISKIGKFFSEGLVEHLKEQNEFLKQEWKETRTLLSSTLENITRQNQSSV